MGYIENKPRYEWWRVKEGALTHKNRNTGELKIINGYEGVVVGIRHEYGTHNNKPTSQLQVLMEDSQATDSLPVCIAGSLFYYAPSGNRDTVSVWARQFICSLLSNKGSLPAHQILTLRFWPFNETTCCAVDVDGTKLPQATIDKTDVAKFDEALKWLEAKYPWPKEEHLNGAVDEEYLPREVADVPPLEDDGLPF